MSLKFSDQQLQAYLDEQLPTAGMSALEQALRVDAELRDRLVLIAGQREAGVHGLGEIWRRNQLSCPTREQLGMYLLGASEEGVQDYIEFHIREVGCRLCDANLEDLRQQREQSSAAQSRRRRYFQTSAGLLRPQDGKN